MFYLDGRALALSSHHMGFIFLNRIQLGLHSGQLCIAAALLAEVVGNVVLEPFLDGTTFGLSQPLQEHFMADGFRSAALTARDLVGQLEGGGRGGRSGTGFVHVLPCCFVCSYYVSNIRYLY